MPHDSLIPRFQDFGVWVTELELESRNSPEAPDSIRGRMSRSGASDVVSDDSILDYSIVSDRR